MKQQIEILGDFLISIECRDSSSRPYVIGNGTGKYAEIENFNNNQIGSVKWGDYDDATGLDELDLARNISVCINNRK